MLPILQIGPLALQFPGLILLVGLWLGLTIAERNSKQFNILPSLLYNLSLWMLFVGILGARLSYVIQFPSAFLESPGSLLSLNPGLLDPIGGLAVSLIAGLIYGQRKRIPLWHLLDALTPLLGVLFIAINGSNLASGNAYGTPTDLPWGIELWGMLRHPVQIYELVASGVILFITWPTRNRDLITGQLFLKFTALSALSRLFFEAFRAESALLSNGIRTAQIIAWLILAISIWGISKFRRKVN